MGFAFDISQLVTLLHPVTVVCIIVLSGPSLESFVDTYSPKEVGRDEPWGTSLNLKGYNDWQSYCVERTAASK